MGKKTHKHLRAISSDTATAISIEQVPGLDRVVSEAQAAELLGYSKDTLRRQFRAGRAPARVYPAGASATDSAPSMRSLRHTLRSRVQ